jgi:glyoxylase-like metal-dependent hydrolase (beta-lactamase superfamily II)
MTKVIPIDLGFVNAYGLKGEDKTILVDTGVPGSASKIFRWLGKHGIRPGDVSLIVLTHGHIDHFGSVRELKEKTGAKVAIHKYDAVHLRRGRNPKLNPISATGRIFKIMIGLMFGRKQLEGVEPDILIENELDLTKFGVKGKAIHTPGHTVGSVSVVLDDGKTIVGDLVMAHKRKARMTYFADDLQMTKESIHRVAEMPVKTIYASHGGELPGDSLKHIR